MKQRIHQTEYSYLQAADSSTNEACTGLSMRHVSESTLAHVREMFCTGLSVSEIARAVEKHLAVRPDSSGHEIEPHAIHALKNVFQLAFSLSITATMPLRGWSSDGSGEISDIRLNELLLPAIVRERDQWASGVENAQWLLDVAMEPWEEVVLERPSSVPEVCWEHFDDNARAELRCLHNRANAMSFRTRCLAAQVQQLSMTLAAKSGRSDFV